MSNLKADQAQMRRHWSVLCNDIGYRFAGTANEQKAADYIEGQFRRFGLENIHQHRFDMPDWTFTKCTVRAGKGSTLKPIKTARPLLFSRSTPTLGVRGPLVYLLTGLPLDFKQPTRGKIGLLIGSLALADPKMKQRVMDSGLKALLVVDSRIPVRWMTSSGAAPQWVDGYTMPSVSISYFDAVDLVKRMPQNVEVQVQSRIFPGRSQNVVGEIIGSEKPNEVIVVSGHHDAVWGNVGADDNGTGVVFTLEMARMFARRPRKPRRTMRFISYGVEERLSVGSYLYMRSLSPREIKRCVFAFNCDGGASTVGEDEVRITGNAPLFKLATDHWNKAGHSAKVFNNVTPYSDHFPMNLAGVPSIYVGRPSMGNGGYWTLHSVYDNLDNVSPAVAAKTINTSAALLAKVADSPRLPFPPRIDSAVMKEIQAMAKVQYRHPWSADQFDYNA